MLRHVTPLVALILLLSACSPGADSPVFRSIGTGGTGGIYYPLGGGLANQLSAADSSQRWTAEVTGGSVENVNRVISGQIDLGFSLSVAAWQAHEADPESPLRIAAPLYPNVVHVLVREASGITGMADLRGMRVSVGSSGSGTERTAAQLLEAWDLDYDAVDVRFLSFSESAAALRDGALDAAILSVGFPAAAVLDALSAGGIRILDLDEAGMGRVLEAHPYYTRAEIPAGSYDGVDRPIPTVGMMNWLVARADADETIIRPVLNILGDGGVSLSRVHPMARRIRIEALDAPPIPLHAVTEAWWSERDQ